LPNDQLTNISIGSSRINLTLRTTANHITPLFCFQRLLDLVPNFIFRSAVITWSVTHLDLFQRYTGLSILISFSCYQLLN